jgi:3-hydroxyisobutyrate dehydrogenase-like beta-hydroxyacid dehydrogenase
MAKDRIGFIGLGVMGKPMARNLLKGGHDVVAFSRTRASVDEVAGDGATAASSAREVGEQADVVILMLPDSPQVREVLDGDDGLLAGAREGSLVIDMSTISPVVTREIAAVCGERGIGWVDAPVSGGDVGAREATLSIMAGGSEEDFGRARPFFDAMGETILHVGPLGHGQTVKVISNAVSATNAATLAQALVVGKATGVDLEALVAVLGASSSASTMVTLKAKPMLAHDYTPLFRLEHMLKDVGICLDESEAAGAPFPSAALARELYNAAKGRGLADEDFAAVLEAVEGLAGVRL